MQENLCITRCGCNMVVSCRNRFECILHCSSRLQSRSRRRGPRPRIPALAPRRAHREARGRRVPRRPDHRLRGCPPRVRLPRRDRPPARHRRGADEGPFHRKSDRWRFADLPEGGRRVDFHVDFEFRSRLPGALIGVSLHDAVRRMVAAFEARAHALYGSGAGRRRPMTESSGLRKAADEQAEALTRISRTPLV